MKIIGITGPSGSGKGTAGLLLQKYGIPTIDTDKLYRKILIPPSPCLDELRATFGDSIIRADGTLDRKALAAIVFTDKTKLSLLNSVTHKYILARVKKRIAYRTRRGERAVIVDAPALFESGFDKKCDITITITASRKSRIERIMQRDRLDRAAAERRIDGQPPEEFYTSRADYAISNDGSPEELEAALLSVLRLKGIIT
ncbi:MAG TPA: dephospho-CoA kinase [Clostridiales bacterium]|nr:dephospho-CoA kinase [Clostridiales bacterium]